MSGSGGNEEELEVGDLGLGKGLKPGGIPKTDVEQNKPCWRYKCSSDRLAFYVC